MKNSDIALKSLILLTWIPDYKEKILKREKQSILFRPIRKFLSEAMSEIKEINNLSELFDACDFEGSEWNKNKSKIEFDYQGEDDRIGWHSYLVVIDGMAAGYTNGVINE